MADEADKPVLDVFAEHERLLMGMALTQQKAADGKVTQARILDQIRALIASAIDLLPSPTGKP